MKNIPHDFTWFDSSDATTGSSDEIRVFQFLGKSDPVKEAQDFIPNIENKIVSDQAEKLLFMIQKMVGYLKYSRPDLKNIPKLILNAEENGAVSIEWIFPDFRVGFNLEPNPTESGWHLISNKKLNEITMSGQLKSLDATIPSLMNFIIGNI
jgi:hypothetical protein